MLYAYLAIGGVLGTLARVGLGGWIQNLGGPSFPWGTFGVNLLGSFLLGLAMRGAELSALSPELRASVSLGFCGAFTTFSTFSYETVLLLQAGAWARASIYALGSLGMGLLAILLGLATADFLMRAEF